MPASAGHVFAISPSLFDMALATDFMKGSRATPYIECVARDAAVNFGCMCWIRRSGRNVRVSQADRTVKPNTGIPAHRVCVREE